MINPDLFDFYVEKDSTRAGFGKGILKAAKKNKKVIALTADLSGSVKLKDFIKKYPERFIQVGVAEQNLATIGSGLANTGKIPFITSFAMFNPGRNWEQIRTTICYNNQNVKIVGSHAGLGVEQDGATHQALEDIAITRVIPNMVVVEPCDYDQAIKATIEISKTKNPTYLRVHRQKIPKITLPNTPFKIGKAQFFKKGKKIAIISSGPIIFEALKATKKLEKKGKRITVVNMHTIKPLDENALLEIAENHSTIITLEDHQIVGGLGSAVVEFLSEKKPIKTIRLGVKECFGESGTIEELYKKHGLNAESLFKLIDDNL